MNTQIQSIVEMLNSDSYDDIILGGGVWSGLDFIIRERIIRLVVKGEKWKYGYFTFVTNHFDHDKLNDPNYKSKNDRDYIKKITHTAGVDHSTIVRNINDVTIRISLNERMK